ncbi:hypothetical protein Golob_001925 [Gossypium lobatum]|uniref:RNase H type-1 domain-containing protein n=1 Tax=Gossypium lobatum TaxID=34289 RepID=A0A7J8N3I8_9ROSI|nr:hypothetical protein [Gossypium lobatum]
MAFTICIFYHPEWADHDDFYYLHILSYSQYTLEGVQKNCNEVTNKAMCKAIEYFAISAPIKSFPILSIVGVRWHPPPQGWFKLNTNGFALSNPGNGWVAFVKDLNIRNIIVELDAIVLTAYIKNDTITNPLLFSLVHECRTIISQFERHKFQHTFREDNRCMNMLAKLGSSILVCSTCIHFVNNLHTV